MKFPVLLPRLGLLALGLTAAGARAGAQDYRLSAELPSDWLDEVESFVVAGPRVVFQTSSQGSAVTGGLWSVPADRSAPPVLLYAEEQLLPLGSFVVARGGEWVLYTVRFPTLTRLAAQRIDGSGKHFVGGSLPRLGAVTEFQGSTERVVYRADQDVAGRFELYSQPLDGSAPAVKLSGALPVGADVQAGLRLSPDERWVVYRADQESAGVLDLYAAPLDGSAPAVRLNTTRPLADVQADFQISFDSLGVVYRADPSVDELFELFVARIDGSGTPLQRSGALVAGGDVLSFRITAGDERLVYLADQETDGVNELYATPTFAGASVELSGTMTAGGDVSSFRLSADGQRVVYLADALVDERPELFTVTASGGAPLALVPSLVAYQHVELYELDPDGAHVAFTADLDTEAFALYRVPLDLSAPTQRLSGPQTSAVQRVSSFRFAPSSARIVYVSDERLARTHELYSVPADGSLAPTRLDGPAYSGVEPDYALTPDGTRVVYRTPQGTFTPQLWSVPVGGGTTLRLNEPFRRGAAGDLWDVVLAPDGECAYYTTYRDVNFSGSYAYDLWRVALDQPRRALRLSEPGVGGSALYGVAVSPDGAWLTYGRAFSGASASELYVVASDGSRPPMLLHSASSGLVTAFTPDSSRVVFHGTSAGVRSAPLDGGGSSVLLDGGSVDSVRLAAAGALVVYTKTVAGQRQLWSVPTLGGAPLRLVAALSGGLASREAHALTADGLRAVYVGANGALFMVPVDGSAPAARISDAMVAGGNLQVDMTLGPPFALTPDGQTAVYLADQDTDEVYELYRVPVAGGSASVKLSAPLVSGGDVGGAPGTFRYLHDVFQLSPDGTRVLYIADAELDERNDLYSVPLDASAAPVRVSASLAPGESVADFGLAPDSARVAYRVEHGVYDLYSAPLDGSGAARLLDTAVRFGEGYGAGVGQPPFRFTPDGQGVVYVGYGPPAWELRQVELDGSAPPRTLNGPLVAGGNTLGFGGDPRFELTRDGGRVVYIADPLVDQQFELFATFLDHRPRRAGTPTGR